MPAKRTPRPPAAGFEPAEGYLPPADPQGNLGGTVTPAAPGPGEPFVHPTAAVDPGAELGPGCKVWHFSHVQGGAKVGPGTILGQGVNVGPGVRIGAGCKIQNHVSVYAGVTVEDEVFLGPSCVFTNVLTPRAHVDRRAEFKRTKVARGASVGANATILCGIELGEHCLVGAGAVVTRDVPAHALVVGAPARRAGWVCRCGLKLKPKAAGKRWDCPGCGAAYALKAGALEAQARPG